MASYGYLVFNTINMTDCNKASALVEWLAWTQTSDKAKDVASNFGLAVAGQSLPVRKKVLKMMEDWTCGGKHIFSLYGCINGATVCSNHGVCTDYRCNCETGFTGTYCEILDVSSSSDFDIALVLGVVIPVATCFVLLLISSIIIFLVFHNRKEKDDW